MKTTIAAFAVAASLLCPAVASARILEVSFTASQFSARDGAAAPQDPVAGSILFTTPLEDNALPVVLAIDLTIGGHTYAVDDILAGPRGGGYAFGAKASGLDDLMIGSDDFYLYFLGRGQGFGYSTAGSNDSWTTRIISTSTEEIASVPEPGSLALLLIGAGAGAAATLRRRRSA